MKRSYQNSMSSLIPEFPSSLHGLVVGFGNEDNLSLGSKTVPINLPGIKKLLLATSFWCISWAFWNEIVWSSLRSGRSIFTTGESDDAPADESSISFGAKIGAWAESWGLEKLRVLDLVYAAMVVSVLGRICCSSFFFKWVCQKFFISLSVRPGNLVAMADHLENFER